MIWIFKSDKASAGSCENYDDLFQYIREKERLKLRGVQAEFWDSWNFTYFSPQQVSANIEQFQPTEIVKEAQKRKLGFIEICRGDPQSSIEILATHDTDIEALKKQWCVEYCDAHHYIIVENFSTPHNSLQSQWGCLDY
jgi:hypothetical protein